MTYDNWRRGGRPERRKRSGSVGARVALVEKEKLGEIALLWMRSHKGADSVRKGGFCSLEGLKNSA